MEGRRGKEKGKVSSEISPLQNREIPPYEEPQSEVQLEQNETIKEQKAFLDSEGNLICIGETEYLVKAEAAPENTRQLTSFHLISPDGKRINVFSLVTGVSFDTADPEHVRVFVSQKELYQNSYKHEDRRVLTDPFKDHINIIVFLHELGHAQQFTQPEFVSIKDEYDLLVHDPIVAGRSHATRKEIEDIFSRFPEVRKKFDEDTLWPYLALLDQGEVLEKEYDELLAERQTLFNNLRQLKPHQFIKKRALEKQIEVVERLVKPKTQEWNEYQGQIRKLGLESGIQNLLYTVVFKAEADATRRAFGWMNSIREKTGIDLYQPVKREFTKGEIKTQKILDPVKYMESGYTCHSRNNDPSLPFPLPEEA